MHLETNMSYNLQVYFNIFEIHSFVCSFSVSKEDQGLCGLLPLDPSARWARIRPVAFVQKIFVFPFERRKISLLTQKCFFPDCPKDAKDKVKDPEGPKTGQAARSPVPEGPKTDSDK